MCGVSLRKSVGCGSVTLWAAAVLLAGATGMAWAVRPDGALTTEYSRAGAGVIQSPPASGGYAALAAPPAVDKQTAEAIAALSSSAGWRQLAAQAGGGLSVRWNLVTGTPHWVSGRAIALPGVDRLGPDNVEAACLGFVAARADLLKVKPAQLQLANAVKAGGRWYVAFRQIHNGVPVLSGQVTMSFTKDDHLITFGSDVYPDVAAETTPRIDNKQALAVARSDCQETAGDDRISDAQLCILPVRRGSGFEYILCWQLEILQRQAHKKWQYLIDAGTGKIVGKWNALVHQDVTGTVEGEYKPECASDAAQIDPFPHEDVSAQGTEIVIQSWNLDSDPGWTLDPDWQWGTPTGGGSHCLDPNSGCTGTNVVGYNLSGDYPNSLTPTRYATTPAFSCQGYQDVTLRFCRWLGIESSSFDHANIQVSNDGSTWVTVWNHSGSSFCDGAWQPLTYDISAVADDQPAVYIRWGMGTTDSSVTYPGWNIDDVEIVSVQGGVNTVQTQSDGSYSVTLPVDPGTITSELKGLYCDIDYPCGPDARFESGPVHPGEVVSWTWDSSLYHVVNWQGANIPVEPSVYRHVNFVHDYYLAMDPNLSGPSYPLGLNYSMPVVVQLGCPSGYCNAYWDGYGMAFGAGDGVVCDDFGMYAEVVYHEYTHGVTDVIYDGVYFPYSGESGAMNEGWSDYFGCTLSPSQSPLVGDGGLIIGEPNGFRTLDNTYRRETDWYNEVHVDSQMFSGGLWEAWQVLGAGIMDELVHFARYAHATNFEDYVIAILVEDDTRYGDSDLSNGTPHGEAIYTGFGNHGIGGLQYLAPSIIIDDTGGNGNGKLDPGETVNLSLTLTNGWADATNVQATLASADPFVTITKATAGFPNVAHGGMTDNLADAYVLSLNAGCPETHTINFTLEVAADGPYSYSRTCLLYYAVAVDQLAYDDGGHELFLGWGSAGGGLAVRVTPDIYPCFPTHVRLYPGDAASITVTVWDDDDAGDPNTVLGSLPASVPGTADWYDVDISSLGLRIDSGSVYVGWIEGAATYHNGFDLDPPYYERSWVYSGSSWAQQEAYGLWLGNFMIRLRYSGPPDDLLVTPTTGCTSTGPVGGPFSPGCCTYTLTNSGSSSLDWTAAATEPWLDVTPGSGTLADGASTTVDVCINANADALAAGTYTDTLAICNETSTICQTRAVQLNVEGCAPPPPFVEDFESGTLPPYWKVAGTGTYRTQVTTDYAPHGGTHHLTMDSTTSDSYARNELTLCVDLAGRRNVVLTFWAKEFSDEANGPPPVPFTDPPGADFDGVAVSEDGQTWYEVRGLRDLSSSYAQITVDLDAAIAAYGLSYNSTFKIRFNQYDNYPISTDGITLDDIEITGAYGDLEVSPAEGFSSSGYEGGPFDPPCKTYTLTNNGSSSLDWTAAATEPWLDVTPGSGTLADGASTTVDVCINANADALAAGTYTDTLTICNETSTICQTRDVTLTVITCNPPSVPTNPDPNDGATDVPLDTNLSWNGQTPPSCVVIPNARATTEGNSDNGWPFNLALGERRRYQQIYSAAEVETSGVISAIRFRPDGDYGDPFGPTAHQVQVYLGHAATTVATASPTFADNIGPGYTLVYDGPLALSSADVGSPPAFDIIIDVNDVFSYDPAQGDLLMEVKVVIAADSTQFDADGLSTSQTATTRISAENIDDPVGVVGLTGGEAYGLVTMFCFGGGAPAATSLVSPAPAGAVNAAPYEVYLNTGVALPAVQPAAAPEGSSVSTPSKVSARPVTRQAAPARKVAPQRDAPASAGTIPGSGVTRVLSYEGVSLASGSLTTLFAGGNGQSGNMFDLTGKETITITGWDGNINAGGGPATIEVYYVTAHTTYVGKENDPALWTLLDSVTLSTTNPVGTPTNVPIGGLTIASGETVGIYWARVDGNVAYTNGPLGVFENADLRFEDRGTGNAYPFGSVFSPRVWNGTIYYEVGGGPCPTTYDVYFGTDNPPTTLICDDVTDPTCDPTPAPGQVLDPDTTYYWKVVATNCCGTTEGPVWSFSTAPPAQLIATEPPFDGSLPKTLNNLILCTFDRPITLPASGNPLVIQDMTNGCADVSNQFVYVIDPDDPNLCTLEARETDPNDPNNHDVLPNQTWYQINSAPGWTTVEPFQFEVYTLVGDCEGGGRVSTLDYVCVRGAIGRRGDLREDLDGNGRVTTGDYLVVRNNLGPRAPSKPALCP
ncbi:MAG TPA: M36 family metallopeptidase [Phycisphaerae bacterium]|nr:M36 family metallopeptidase [Phycisphaerae bacterium]